MAEGTRLKEINEQIRTLEEKLQTISTECHNAIDEKLQQFGTDYNHKLGLRASIGGDPVGESTEV